MNIARTLDLTRRWRIIKQWLFDPLARNALYLMFNTAIMSLLGFFFWVIVARVYTELEVGFSSAIISSLNLLAAISLMGFNFALVRFLSNSEQPRKLINSTLILSGTVNLVIAAVFISGLPLWAPALDFIRYNPVFILLFIVTGSLITLSSLLTNVFVANRRAIFTLIKDSIIALTKILLAIILALFFRSFGIVASWGFALGIMVPVSIFIFLPRVQKGYGPEISLDFPLITRMWRYSSSSYLVSLLASVPAFILPLVVLNKLGVYSNAYFYVAWMMSNLLNAIPGSVSESLFAESANFPDRQTIKKNVVRSLKLVYLLLIPSVFVIIIISEWLLSAFGVNYVTNAKILLWLLSVSSLFMGFTGVYTSILKSQDKLKELIWITGLSSLLVLVFSYFLISYWGITCIGFIWLGVQGIMSIVLVFRLLYWLKH